MINYATVLVERRHDSGDYYAAPVLGGFRFLLKGSKIRNLRNDQPVRITAWYGTRTRFATKFYPQNWDVELESICKGLHDTALILYDPLQKDTSKFHFISLATEKEKMDLAVGRMLNDFSGDADTKSNSFYSTEGRRGYTLKDFRPEVPCQVDEGGILFVPLERLVSWQDPNVDRSELSVFSERFNLNQEFGIDYAVVRLCCQYAHMH